MIRHLELKAYGKINLGLDVVRRREDGYHEVRMIMQTVRVYDAIELNRTEEEGIRLSTNLYYLPDNENNLGYRAAKLLMDEFGIRDGVEIKMKKFIPVAAGMAGGSSDAAAVLFGVNKMFGLGLSKQELMERGVVSGVVAYRYMGRLEQAMQLLQHGKGHGTLKRWNGRFRALWHRGVRAVLRELPGNMELAEQTEEMRWLQTATRTYAVEHLEAAVASSQVPTEDAAAVLVEYQRSVAALHDARPTVTSVIKAGDRTEDIKRKAYTFELEQIQSAYEDDRLSCAHAQRMRESVQLMQMDLEDSV